MFYLLFVLIFLIGFYFILYKARPASNQQGKSIKPPKTGFAAQQSNEIIVGTYNVQTGKNAHAERDILRSADIIQNADIVGIQEVYAATYLGGKNQAQQLAEHGDFGWLFAATRRRWLREHRGNALLSKLPVKRWSIEMLPDQTGKQFRNLTTAFIDFNGQEIAVLVTHLHTKKGKTDQLQIVLEKFKQYDIAILLGDFNTTNENSLIKTFLSESMHLDAFALAMPDMDLQNRIDWILTKGFKVEGASYDAIGVSDHPYYQVRLSLKKNVTSFNLRYSNHS